MKCIYVKVNGWMLIYHTNLNIMKEKKKIIKRKKKDEKGHEDHIFGWKGGA
jgi:hypothetical protein